MSSNKNPVRRLFWLLLLATAGAAAYARWRDRSATTAVSEPPAWPPLDGTNGSPAPAEPLPGPDPTTETERPVPLWLRADPDGTCPSNHPIKANEKSGIFHVPDGQFYERTKAERCYATADAAVADGYRQAKS